MSKKCHYVNDKGTQVLIPKCMSVVQSNDIEDCICFRNKVVINKLKGHDILNDLISEQQEIISNPIRFNGVSIEKIKQVFEKYGINYELPF